MDSWEKVFIGVTLGLVLTFVIANAVYLCCGKARRRRLDQKSSKRSADNDES